MREKEERNVKRKKMESNKQRETNLMRLKKHCNENKTD